MGREGIKAKLQSVQNSTTQPLTQDQPDGSAPACLITGAATRIGAVLAQALANAGWDIALHYRHSGAKAQALAQSLQQTGRQAACFQADLSNAASVEALFDAAAECFPRLSCVVNNASQFEFDRPESASAQVLTSHYQTNLIAPVILTRCLHEHLKPAHRAGSDPLGVVIHLLDQKLTNPNPDFFSYTLSKAALLEATRLSAAAFAPVLRVVGVAPGITLPSADQTEEEFKRTHAMTPLGASSRPEEIAQAVVWLASARAVTGTMLLVDGGQHLMAQPRDVMMMIRS
ncbi:MAG: SDR family oxidoreductase [Burkholderiaceae bacterium]|nr:SDR family oxidoreductase [Burkholderiaceae bacterium]